MIAEVRVILNPHFGYDTGGRHFNMLRNRKRQRDEVLHFVTPGADRLLQRTVRGYRFNRNRPRLLVPISAAVAGAGVIGETIRRGYNRATRAFGSQTTKTKTKNKSTQTPKSLTMAYYNGRFKAPMKISPLDGVIYKQEYPLVVTDAQTTGGAQLGCAWVGGTCISRNWFHQTILLAILRKLVRVGGHEFNSGDDRIVQILGSFVNNLAGELKYHYKSARTNLVSEHQISLESDATWNDVAAKWLSNLRSVFSTPDEIHFLRVHIIFKVNNNGNNRVMLPSWTLPMIGLKIKFKVSHTLFIQNRTNDSGNGDATDTVDTNPLMGKLYEINSSNIATQQITVQGPATTNYGVMSPSSGFLNIKPTDWNEGSARQAWARPFGPKFLKGCKKVSNITLQPGEIKKHRIDFQDNISFDKLWLKVMGPEVDEDRNPFLYGKSQLIGLSKVVRTNTSLTAGPPIVLGCTARHFMVAEALPKTKMSFIAENVQGQSSGELPP